jgi:hypothetical protein
MIVVRILPAILLLPFFLFAGRPGAADERTEFVVLRTTPERQKD